MEARVVVSSGLLGVQGEDTVAGNEIWITTVDLSDADEATYREVNGLMEVLRAERWPEDPPVALAERISQWQNVPPVMHLTWWLARDGEKGPPVGYAYLNAMQLEENRHMAEATVAVHPAYRRRGIGRRLAGAVAEAALADGRRLLLMQTVDRVPAGERFMEAAGGRRGMAKHVNQLVLDEVDAELLAAWSEARPEAFEIGVWDGPYPEEDMAGIVTLYEVMNTAPHDDLEVEAVQWTPEMVRQIERYQLAGDKKRWVAYARERDSGRFAGFSEVELLSSRPQIVNQGNTGVLPQYRGRGLGKALKAAMLRKLLAEWPGGRYVRTGNADSNAPMLGINHALGFRPYVSATVWQVETERLLME